MYALVTAANQTLDISDLVALVILVAWIASWIACPIIAYNKNRHWWAWLALSIAFGFFAWLAIGLIRPSFRTPRHHKAYFGPGSSRHFSGGR